MKNNVFLNNLNIEEIKSEDKNNLSSFVFNNLPNELAITLGNYYRRFILSYMQGISIFGLKISNNSVFLKSEFSILEGLVETPPYLISNLKKVIFSLKEDSDESRIFSMKISINNDSDNEYQIKASDIFDPDKKVEVLNPEVHLATLAPSSSLEIEIYCKRSWGFKRQSEFESFENDLNTEDVIMIDSNHNPILNAYYSIDFVVTGLEKQDEKLVLNIETNGSLTPRQALKETLNLSFEVNKAFLNILEKENDN